MAFADYTTPDEVRGVLGISHKEVSNVVITGDVYLTGLLEALYGLAVTLPADYKAISDLSTRTPLQNRFVLLVQTFCAYTAALQLIPSLKLAAPQVITDGKTAMERVDNPHEALRPQLVASIDTFKTSLMAVYAELNPAITAPVRATRTNVVRVGTASDPILGT